MLDRARSVNPGGRAEPMIFPPKPKNRFHLGLKKAEDPEAHW